MVAVLEKANTMSAPAVTLVNIDKMERQEVARGARLLDNRLPGWEWKINIKELNMNNPYLCILGQLYGQYYKGGRELFGEIYNPSERIAHGFINSKEDWVKEIKSRINAEDDD